MYAVRDVLILVGVVAMAAAVATNVVQSWENNFSVPACTDCGFKVTGDFVIVQEETSAYLARGGRVVARYGWAYLDGVPLKPGEAVKCQDVMYIWVVGGVAYISCRGTTQPLIGRVVLH